MSEQLQISNSIRKAKLDKYGCLTITYDKIITHESGPVVNNLTQNDGHKAHPDLLAAFHKLNRHMALVCEQVRKTDEPFSKKKMKITSSVNGGEEMDATDLFGINAEDHGILSRIKVTGFSLSENAEGVTLIGMRKLASGQVLNLISPFIKYEDYNDETLPMQISDAESEVLQYLDGKYSEEVDENQLEMEFSVEENEEFN